MVVRQDLERLLKETFEYEKFEDYCQNGLQVEGKTEIHKLVVGVSFNLPLLESAIEANADAIFVHHGIFGKNFFCVKGVLKHKVKLLLQHDISLFGIHLPLDAHEQYGNNAQLAGYLGAEIIEPFDVGVIAHNTQKHSLAQIMEVFHQCMHPRGIKISALTPDLKSPLMPTQKHGFIAFPNGPDIPEKLAIISGGSARNYRSEALLEKGVDTFICGSVEEATPAWSYESRTNFLNIGHYWSEKAGVRAVQALLEERFDIETLFVEIENLM